MVIKVYFSYHGVFVGGYIAASELFCCNLSVISLMNENQMNNTAEIAVHCRQMPRSLSDTKSDGFDVVKD